MNFFIAGSEKINSSKYSRVIAVCLLTLLSLLIAGPVIFLISSYYGDYIWFLYGGVENKPVLESHALELTFKIAKLLSPLLLMWLIMVWYDFFNEQKRKIVGLIIRTSNAVIAAIRGNKEFFSSLKKETRFIITVFFVIVMIALLYFVFFIPLQYDEWASYNVFAGPGFWPTVSNYVSTNNHVFYNLMACVFTKLPIDAEIAMRIPNLIVTPLCLWYFFKLCKLCFSDAISLALLVFVICPHPVMMYAFAARGYMCLNLFCVLIMYSSFFLSQNYANKKYRILFILSLVLGAFSIPTFIYAVFPVAIILFIYVVKQKSLTKFFLLTKDALVSGLLILLSYSFILIFNDYQSMMNLNNFSNKLKLSEAGTFDKIIAHLESVGSYLFFGVHFLPLICVLVLLSTFFFLYKSKSKSSYICVLSAFMFFSPLLILILQRVIPFERNWVFLIFPSAICLGFIVHNIISLSVLQRFVYFSGRYKLYLSALVLSLAIFSFSRFTTKHETFAQLDFKIETLRKRYLNSVINNIKEIALTKKSYEFYPADVIWNVCLKTNPKKQVKIDELVQVNNQDILIIDITELDRFKDQLSNYKLLSDMNYQVMVYGRIGLF